MRRRVFPSILTLIAVQFLASSATAQLPRGDYKYQSAVNVALGSTVPSPPPIPQTTPPPPLTIPPSGGTTPTLAVQINARPALTAEGTGSSGCMMGFGSMTLAVPPIPATGILTYPINFSYNFVTNIFDLSNNESPAPMGSSGPIGGNISGSVVVKASGVVSVQLTHRFVGMSSTNTIPVTCAGTLGTTVYTLNFGACGLKTTPTPFPCYQEYNLGVFGAFVTATF